MHKDHAAFEPAIDYGKDPINVDVSPCTTASLMPSPGFESDDSSSDDRDKADSPTLTPHKSSNAVGESAGEKSTPHCNGVQDGENTAALRRRIAELLKEIKGYQIQLEVVAPIPGLSVSTIETLSSGADLNDLDLRNSKIVHQAKIIRHLKRAVLKEQQNSQKDLKLVSVLTKKNEDLQRDLENAKFSSQSNQLKDRSTSGGNNQVQSSRPESAASTGKNIINRISWRTKYDDLRLRYDRQHNASKRLQRAFASEIGADTSMSLEELLKTYERGTSALNTNCTAEVGKRARAQQIILLKAKVNKLEKDLALAHENSDPSTRIGDDIGSNVDQKAEENLCLQVANKQKQMSQLVAENAQINKRMHDVQVKLQALKCRVQILEKERKESLSNVQILAEKSKNDDLLIDALQIKLRAWKKRMHQARKAHTAGNGDFEDGGAPSIVLPPIRMDTKNSSATLGKKPRKQHVHTGHHTKADEAQNMTPTQPSRSKQFHYSKELLKDPNKG